MHLFKEIAEKIRQSKKIEQISDVHGKITDFLQDEELFFLNYHRGQRQKKFQLRNNDNTHRKIYLGPLLRNVELQGYDVEMLPSNFLSLMEKNAAEFQEKITGAYVILNNNDFSGATPNQLEAYLDLYHAAQDTIFVVWDGDNHHWLSLGLLLAMHSDYYFPAHPENYSIYSKFNADIQQHNPLGCIQWKKDLLKNEIDNLLTNERKDGPLGSHGFYSKFSMRNKIISTMSSRVQSVGFSNGEYRGKTEKENLLEWASYKLHFVVPVNSDLPYRIFDGLITGGIVFVPSFLKTIAPDYLSHPNILSYSEIDLMDPNSLINRGLERFNEFRKDSNNKQQLLDLIDDVHASNFVKKILSIVNKQQSDKVKYL